MVSEIRTRAVTIPANTPKTAPVTIDISFPPRIVTAIRWTVPPGPSGLMGWALTIAGNPVIPRDGGTYIVTDNDKDTWQLEDYPTQGMWQVTGYNTDIYPHTVYLDLLLDQLTQSTPVIQQISNDLLSSPAPPAPVVSVPNG